MCEHSQYDIVTKKHVQIESLRVVVRKQNMLNICIKHNFDFLAKLCGKLSNKGIKMTPAIWQQVNKMYKNPWKQCTAVSGDDFSHAGSSLRKGRNGTVSHSLRFQTPLKSFVTGSGWGITTGSEFDVGTSQNCGAQRQFKWASFISWVVLKSGPSTPFLHPLSQTGHLLMPLFNPARDLLHFPCSEVIFGKAAPFSHAS